MINTCSELGGREQNAVSPRTVLPILGTAQPLNSGGRLVRHLSVSRKLRSIGKCFSLWCRWYTGNSALRGQPRCGAPTALTLTYLPIAVPSWEDLGENSYEWLPEWVTSSEFCDNLFSPFSISLALGRKQNRPERKTYRSVLHRLSTLSGGDAQSLKSKDESVIVSTFYSSILRCRASPRQSFRQQRSE